MSGILSLQCMSDAGTISSKDAALHVCLWSNFMPLIAVAIAWTNELIRRTLCHKRYMWYSAKMRPKLSLGVSFLVTCFETFFLVICTNAINLAFSVYDHPKPWDDKSSLQFQPSILTDSDLAGKMRAISYVSMMIWCVGYSICILSHDILLVCSVGILVALVCELLTSQ